MSGTASSTIPAVAPRRRTPRIGVRAAVVVLAAAVVLGACSSEDELGGTVVEDGLGCTITSVERNTGDVPVIEKGSEVGETTTTEDLEDADDAACKADASTYLTLDLVGAKVSDGAVFNTTYDDERPLSVRLGQGQLIAGLETGLTDQAVGSRRQIVVPAAEAYGADGDEALGIGPDEDLEFVVDLISLTDSPAYCQPATSIPEGTVEGKPTEVAMPDPPPTDEVVTTVLTPGDGPEAAADSYVTVHYLGVSCATGTQFDSSWDNGEPITVALSEAEATATAFSVIEGWTEGMVGQSQGSRIQIDIPSDLAYGSTGQPPSILPNDPLTFVVDILEVSDEPPPDPAAESTTTASTTTEAG